MAIFHFFQDGGSPPSWISAAHFESTNKEYFLVFLFYKIWFELQQ